MNQYILVAIGGAIGSIGRYAISGLFTTQKVYWATLLVNVLGGLIIGTLIALKEKNLLNHNLSLLFITGFCGGFTTFSAFSREALFMMQQQKFYIAFAYILSSVVLAIVAAAVGYYLTIKKH
jgi:CrcB protein